MFWFSYFTFMNTPSVSICLCDVGKTFILLYMYTEDSIILFKALLLSTEDSIILIKAILISIEDSIILIKALLLSTVESTILIKTLLLSKEDTIRLKKKNSMYQNCHTHLFFGGCLIQPNSRFYFVLFYFILFFFCLLNFFFSFSITCLP